MKGESESVLEDIEVAQAIPQRKAEEADDVLRSLAGKTLMNRDQNLPAQINSTQRGKLESDAALGKSLANGFSTKEHFTALANIEFLYENAVLLKHGPDEKNKDPTVTVRRFAAPIVFGDVIADALLTLKETANMVNSVRIYSLELTEIKKPSELAAKDSLEENNPEYYSDGRPPDQKAEENRKTIHPCYYPDGIEKLNAKHRKVKRYLDVDKCDAQNQIVFGKKVSDEEIQAMKNTINLWLSEENLFWAKGKTLNEVKEKLSQELKPISYIDAFYIHFLSSEITDNRVYCAEWYFVDHSANHHPEVLREDYNEIQNIIDNPDDVKLDERRENRKSIIFIKNIGKWGTVIIGFGYDNDKKILLFHKSFFKQRGKSPYRKLQSIKNPRWTTLPTISPAANATSAVGRFSALEDVNTVPSNSSMSNAKSNGFGESKEDSQIDVL